ncbi:hypothetical protein CAEBREN_17573 [Caenorhabditis brenneri]|uniref:RRM domain-containing protein n=1 Tax=Caenorhabditis brenneri TaxID=135651 RepID=G0NPV0_CAEBE|nr:hypothetical protein CAEBREN_17573 [Caenorhabditis brenneri]
MLLADKRSPSNEPTLMIGDVPANFDFTLLDDFICVNINAFYQYESFEEARTALRKLNGLRVPGMPSDFQIDLCFTKQNSETCLHLSVHNLHFNRFEIMRLFTRYMTVLGLAQYNFVLWNGHTPKTTCFIRFGDQEECMQAVQELNWYPVERSSLHLTISTRYIDLLNEYVSKREKNKKQCGIPMFKNVYPKQEVSIEKFNDIIVSKSYDLFDDLEGSRWSSVAFRGPVRENDYIRQMTLSRFEDL